MRVTSIPGLPRLSETLGRCEMCVSGPIALVSTPHFLARISLDPAKLDWLVDRPDPQCPQNVCREPRRINLGGSTLCIDETRRYATELAASDDGGMMLCIRSADTGKPLWERAVPLSQPTDWAENPP